jgi:hypothetical protein
LATGGRAAAGGAGARSLSAFAFSISASACSFSSSAWASRRKYWRTLSATAASTELEWVFFSVTPSFGNNSTITFAFTSSSRASSLIRI